MNKNIKKIISAFLIIFIMIIGINSVKGVSPSGTGGAETITGTVGDGSWASWDVGLKIGFVDIQNGNKELKKTVILLNSQAYKKRNSLLFAALNNKPFAEWIGKDYWFKIGNITDVTVDEDVTLPNNYCKFTNGECVGVIDIFDNYLQKKDESGKSNIVKILTKYFGEYIYNSSDNASIVVEPMTNISGYFGTMYELDRAFAGTEASCKNGDTTYKTYNDCYGNYLAKGNITNGCMMSSTIKIIGDNVLGLKKANCSMECVMDKNCGDSIGLYKVDDYIEKTGKIIIEKYDSNTNNIINGALFDIYKMNDSGKYEIYKENVSAGIAPIGNLKKGHYLVEEVRPPEGYDKPEKNIKRYVLITGGKTVTLKFYNKLKGPSITVNKYLSKNGKATDIRVSGAEFKLCKMVDGKCKTKKEWQWNTTTENPKTINGLEDGKYEIIEIHSPDGYNASSKQTFEVSGSKITKIGNEKKSLTSKTFNFYNEAKNLQITKVNDHGLPVAGASLRLCKKLSNGSCKTEATWITDKTGKKVFNVYSDGLEWGAEYNIYEDKAPDNSYIKLDSPITFTLNDDNLVIKIQNRKRGCNEDLADINNKYSTNTNDYYKAIQALYEKYLIIDPQDGGGNYNNLLDKSKRQTVCKNISCNYDDKSQCLSGSYGNSTFSSTNLSCYNQVEDISGNKIYCLNTFELTNNLGATSWFAKPGRMPIQYLEPTAAATGILSKECYSFVGSDIDYKLEYLASSITLTFDSSSLPKDKDEDTVISCKTSNAKKCNITINYNLNRVYAEKLSGEITITPDEISDNNYTFLGYGIISKLDAKAPYNVYSKLTLDSKIFKIGTNETTYTGTCNVTPGDWYPKDIEFRSIDTTNAFPGKTGNNDRIVGTNWKSQDVIWDTKLIEEINNNKSDVVIKESKYDLNRDGKIDDEDIKIVEWRLNNNITADWDKSNNVLISYIMATTNNSYNKNKIDPIFKLTLTADIIKQIRTYNANHSYDDVMLECEADGKNCKSKFLEALNNGTLDSIINN